MAALRPWPWLGALTLAGWSLLSAPAAAANPAGRSKQPAGAAAAGASGAADPTAAANPSAVPLSPKLELEGPEVEAKDRARELFQRGVAAYREGRFYDAVAMFLETQRIYPDTQLCFNIARAYESLGNTSAALSHYRDYLRRSDRPSDGKEVQERVHRLEQALAARGVQQLSVLSTPEGATLLLDGKPVGITPWTGETWPGKHRVALELAAHRRVEQVIEVEALAARDFSFALAAQPRPPEPWQLAPPPALDSREKRARISVPTLVTLGAGLGLLSGALIAEAASGEPGLSRTSAFFAGGGLGVSVVGGVMLYFDFAPRFEATPSAVPLRTKDSASAYQ